MSTSACCSARNADSYECLWNCDRGFKCDLNVKTDVPSRRKREFTPDEHKDENYWMKRSRNNEAAKRSRERRRVEERLLEERALQLFRENEKLKAALSAIRYHWVGKETSYDALLDYSPVGELSRDSELRCLVDFPGAHCVPHYALGPVYNPAPLPRLQNFPAASFPVVDSTHPRDRYLGIYAPSDRNNIPYALTQRKWGEGHAHATMTLYPNSAPFSLNEMVPGYQSSAGTTRRRAAHARLHDTYMEQRSHEPEPSHICKETEAIREPERVPTSPLLPHKLRYKARKAQRGEERVPSSPGISHHTQ